MKTILYLILAAVVGGLASLAIGWTRKKIEEWNHIRKSLGELSTKNYFEHQQFLACLKRIDVLESKVRSIDNTLMEFLQEYAKYYNEAKTHAKRIESMESKLKDARVFHVKPGAYAHTPETERAAEERSAMIPTGPVISDAKPMKVNGADPLQGLPMTDVAFEPARMKESENA